MGNFFNNTLSYAIPRKTHLLVLILLLTPFFEVRADDSKKNQHPTNYVEKAVAWNNNVRVKRLRKVLKCIEEGGEKNFKDARDHLSAIIKAAKTPPAIKEIAAYYKGHMDLMGNGLSQPDYETAYATFMQLQDSPYLYDTLKRESLLITITLEARGLIKKEVNLINLHRKMNDFLLEASDAERKLIHDLEKSL